jgi:pimeloyl-ACP methyl ester carboxylesterase
MTHFELDRSVVVDGATVRYAVNGQGTRDLLLVHGAGAHQLWFYRMFDALQKDWRVITVDLTGHGFSDHREKYTVETWANELAAILRAECSEPALVAGHSMGSRVALALTANNPELVRELIMIDGNIRSPEEIALMSDRRPLLTPKYYATKEDALARFRLVPGQPEPAMDVLLPVAEYSVVKRDQGWSWRHDWSTITEPYDEYINSRVPQITQPITFVYGTQSPVSGKDKADYFAEIATTHVEIIAIDGGHHHLMLDFPDECLALFTGK